MPGHSDEFPLHGPPHGGLVAFLGSVFLAERLTTPANQFARGGSLRQISWCLSVLALQVAESGRNASRHHAGNGRMFPAGVSKWEKGNG